MHSEIDRTCARSLVRSGTLERSLRRRDGNAQQSPHFKLDFDAHKPSKDEVDWFDKCHEEQKVRVVGV